MKRLALLTLLLSLLAAPGWGREAKDLHTWTDRDGNEVTAEVVAMDSLRAILRKQDATALVVPLSHLTFTDQEFARNWRKLHPDAPLVDPDFPYGWPAEASAADTKVEKHAGPPEEGFHYRSQHYIVRSETDLPNSVVREILDVFEATRAAVMASPLGLLEGSREKPYPVFFFGKPSSYAAVGGSPGSGGSYDGYSGRMLVLLPNLGIDPESPDTGLDYQDRLYVLKHEAVHQLLPPWAWRMPFWLNEGLCEVFASMPYSHGRYHFRNFDNALFEYLQKWRKPSDRNPTITLIEPKTLLQLTSGDWKDRVALRSAYDLYNSAGLLTHYFLHHDGTGQGVGLIGFLAAIREGAPVDAAMETHLLRGRSPEDLKAELERMAERHGTKIEWISGSNE